MIVFVVVMGAIIIAMLGYMGYAINEAFIQGIEKGYSRGYKNGKKDALLDMGKEEDKQE